MFKCVFYVLTVLSIRGSLLLCLLWCLPLGAVLAQPELSVVPATVPSEYFLLEWQMSGQPQFDSLQLQILDDEIAKAHLQVDEANLFHRLIPSIHISASYGMKDIFFYDPTSAISSFLPKDVYRLTLNLSIGDILRTTKSKVAELELHKLLLQREKFLHQMQKRVEVGRQDILLATQMRTMLLEEISMKERIAKFDSLRFDQGKIGFDVFAKSRLDLLNAQRLLVRLDAQLNKLKGQ